MPFKTLLLGTGIASLCTAIALSGKGHTVTVVEETSELKTVGGIIAIHANANRMLDQMGVYQEMLRIYGTEPVHVNEAHVWRLQERIVPSWVGKTGRSFWAAMQLMQSCLMLDKEYPSNQERLTLAECLERAKSRNVIPQYLRFNQNIRDPSCKLVQECGSIQANRATLPDGPEQQERDKRFKAHNAFTAQKAWDGVYVDQARKSTQSGCRGCWGMMLLNL